MMSDRLTGQVHIEVQAESLASMAERMLIYGIGASRKNNSESQILPVQRVVCLKPHEESFPLVLELNLTTFDGASKFNYRVPVKYLGGCENTLFYPLLTMYSSEYRLDLTSKHLASVASSIPDEEYQKLYIDSIKGGIYKRFGKEVSIMPKYTDWDGVV